MNKTVTCPWCEKQTVAKISIIEKNCGKVRERRCTECGKVLAAYLAEEGFFMNSVRKYAN